ncbi:hypothetical protein OOC_13029 [Providencia rettgeri Dmel1]|nr:hypothetical protein OOC_13029 [Providencia rettgeri Dmel1]
MRSSNYIRKVDAPDMRSEASGANNNLCGVTSMSSVNQFQSKKQFRCLPVSKCGPFQYVEIITSADESGNYQTEQQLVDSKVLRDSWAKYYFRSGREVSEQ